MTKKLTVVVGAGASCEYGLPVGADLTTDIAKRLNFQFQYQQFVHGGSDESIFFALREYCRDRGADVNSFIRAAWHIRDAMPQAASIDNFIHNNRGRPEIEFCAKLAILRSILEAERKSTLAVDEANIYNTISFENVRSCWLNPMWKLMIEGCDQVELEDRFRSVAFVIFNYDRCIEHYLFRSLQNYFQMSADEAAQLLSHVDFYHPYGVVGALPWQNPGRAVEFGGRLHDAWLIESALALKTFTEGTDPSSSEVCAIRDVVHESEKLLFLGFAFHPLNMELLDANKGALDTTGRKLTFATTFGLSRHSAEVVAVRLAGLRECESRQVYVGGQSLKCVDLFGEYGPSLSLVN